MAPPRRPATGAARGRRFARALWTEITAIGPHNGAHWPAVRVGICVALPLAASLALGHIDWAPYAIFGSINSVYGKQNSYDARLRAQIGMGLALTAAVFTGTAVGVLAPASGPAVIALAAFSLLGYLLAEAQGWLPAPSLFLVFAAGALSSYPHPTSDLFLALTLPLAAAGFSVLAGQAGRWLPTSRRPRTPTARRRHLRQILADSTARLDMIAHLLGPLLAGLGSTIAGIGHPYWAAVTATVPLVGTTLPAKVARATLRLAGTLAGVVLAYALITGASSVWMLILAIAALQIATELLVARNYGIAVIAITPMALIMTYLGSPQSPETLATDRVLESVIGACVSLAVLVSLEPFRRRRDRPPTSGGAKGSDRGGASSR